MLKKRIMGVIVVRDGIAVQSLGFKRYLPIGRPEIVCESLNSWGIDEISVVDISATKNGAPLNLELVKSLSGLCQVPLTYGGGIKSVDDMRRVVQAGADKIMINQAFLHNPELVTDGAKLLGNQCIVVSLDFKAAAPEPGTSSPSRDLKTIKAYDYLNQYDCDKTLEALAVEAERRGAGEIFINSVIGDGSKQGFDLEVAAFISSRIKVPATVSGGAGHPTHFIEALKIPNISAVAAANFFNFTEHSVTTTKEYILKKSGLGLRHDTYHTYAHSEFLEDGRLAKKSDQALKELLFEFHPKEVI